MQTLLASLRLKESDRTTSELEAQMGAEVLTLAENEKDAKIDEETRARRDRSLAAVKIYYLSYPPQGETGAMIQTFLAGTPVLPGNPLCKGPLTRLEERRRSGSVPQH
jgi:hypothetical protein